MVLVPTNPGNVADASENALSVLKAAINSLQSAPSHETLRDAPQEYKDEIERLETWLKEHHVSEGTLDHKLREASQIRDQVLSLLETLSEIPMDEINTTTNERLNVDDDAIDTEDERLSAAKSTLESIRSRAKDNQSTTSNSLSLDTSYTLPESVPDSPLTRIRDTITLLLQLGPSLSDPTPQDRFSQSTHPSAAEPDINHVRTKFPEAHEELIKRVGRANWERRQRLNRLRLTEIISVEHDPEDDQDIFEGQLSEWTVDSSESRSNASTNYIDNVGQTNMTEDHTTDFEEGSLSVYESESSNHNSSARNTYSTAITAPSTGHKSLGKGAEQDNNRPGLPVPPHPNENLSGATFTCPFCSFKVIGMNSPSDWRKHIREDLQPYMCTHEGCMLSAKTYGSKKAWWHHETETHRTKRRWICPPCKQKNLESDFNTSTEFEQHVRDDHTFKLTDIKLSNIREMCRKDAGRVRPSEVCPFCRETIVQTNKFGRRRFEREIRDHVSKHLEQLTFFVAFPTGQSAGQGDRPVFQDDSSDSEDGIRTEIRSVVSEQTQISKREMHLANVKAFIADQKRTANSGGASPVQRESMIGCRAEPLPGTSANEGSEHSRTLTGTTTPSFPIFLQMPPPTEHFYFRDDLLKDLNAILRLAGRICVLHGIGGVGKTLAAVQYCNWHKEEYDAIFWLQADTAPGLADSYVQLVTALGRANGAEDHHHIIGKGRDWLQETERRWLIVFDNAISWDEISRYMPNSLRNTNGSVLITTHFENILAQADNVTKLRINPLGREDGAEMLLKYLNRDAENDPEKHLAKEISAFVGGLPVAINHVAGYVGFSQYSLEELIETFREWRKCSGVATDEADDLPATFREASFSYDGTLQMVWEVTLRELSQDACDVLDVMAYLNCAAVPHDMLWTVHDDKCLQFLDRRETIRMQRINNSLIKRRLVNRTDGCFSMHRSLQRGIREKLSKDRGKQQKVFEEAVALVRENFPQSNPLQQPTPAKWSEYQKLLPHLHALRDVYRASKGHIRGSTDFAQLLLDAGMDQFEQGITHEGLLLLNTAEKVLDTLTEPTFQGSQVMKADIHAMIAIMYDDTGIEWRQEGLSRRQKALDIRKKTFETATTQTRKDEMLVYNSWMEYAISLLHFHLYEEADPIIQKCFKKFQEWGTEEEIPFEYAKYYNKVALVRLYQGQFDEAIDFATRGVRLMEKTGYKVFSTRFKFDLACILLQSGDIDGALRLHRQIHDQRIKLVGPTNQLSLHSMYAIGAIYEIQGDLNEARTWFEMVLAQRRSLSSWPDEAYSRTQFHLSQVLLAQGRAEEIETAKDLQASALEVFHRLLPPEELPQELKDVTDQAILFDHMLPISPGGPRFTGKGLLECFTRKDDDTGAV